MMRTGGRSVGALGMLVGTCRSLADQRMWVVCELKMFKSGWIECGA